MNKTIKWLEKQGYFEIMKYRRSHESKGEKQFINRVLIPELKATGYKYKRDKAGNYFLQIGKKSQSNILFSSHTDTVHNRMVPGLTQKLEIDENDMSLRSIQKECLGADDGTGMFLMFMLMRKKVPGLYVFHRGEERGGIGSSYIASDWKFDHIKQAVAFDRMNVSHVITHQGGQRCASEEYAEALSEQLAKHVGNDWEPNNGGSFTDTKNYTHLVPECTNLSVGYYRQHSFEEHQDLEFLYRFARNIHKIAWHKLPIVRDATIRENLWSRTEDLVDLKVDTNFVISNAKDIATVLKNNFDDYELMEELKCAKVINNHVLSASSNTRTPFDQPDLFSDLSPVEIQRKNL